METIKSTTLHVSTADGTVVNLVQLPNFLSDTLLKFRKMYWPNKKPTHS